jgi:hypothetical protein
MIIDEIVEILQSQSKGNYRLVSPKVLVADVEFDFDAVMVGPDDQQNIILIYNAQSISLDIVHREIEAFSLILDRTESTRSITLVLITNESNNPTIKSLETLCRVVIVSPDKAVAESLCRLLPLLSRDTEKTIISAEAALRHELAESSQDPLIIELLNAAYKSDSAVEATMMKKIEAAANFDAPDRYKS